MGKWQLMLLPKRQKGDYSCVLMATRKGNGGWVGKQKQQQQHGKGLEQNDSVSGVVAKGMEECCCCI